MTVIGITSSRTSPGATSLATGLALSLSAEHERALLVEADPAGGVLSLRFDLEVTPSLTTFGSDIRNGYSHDVVWRNTQDLRGARCLAAPVDPRLARSWVERVTPDLIEHLPTLGAPAIIDLGWVSQSGPSLGLAEACDVVLIVTRPEIAEVQALLFQVRQMQAVGATVGLVTIGTEPNDPQEIAAVAGVPLVAVLPDDPTVAAALRGAKFAPNKFRRSLLWRTIGGIAASLVDPTTMFARAVGATGADDAISIETFGAPAPSAYAGLAPEVLDAEPAPVPHTPVPQAPVPTAVSYHVPAPVENQQTDMPRRPSFSDRYGATMNETMNKTINETINETMDQAAGGREQVNTDPDAGQRIAQEFDLATASAADIDLTVDPDNYDVTNRLVAQPDAELVTADGDRIALNPRGATFIGRHSGCEIVVKDSQVSRRHGRLTRTVTGWHYADLESRNGSVLNGRPCNEAFLAPGDELYVGSARLVFQSVPIREMETA